MSHEQKIEAKGERVAPEAKIRWGIISLTPAATSGKRLTYAGLIA